jgi:Protein of unknown function (DUF998)
VSLEREARLTRYLLACGLAPALFVAVVLVEGAIRPGYDPLHHFGSELSLGSSGWMQVTNFLGTGTLVLGFAAGLRRALGSGRGSVAAPILTAVFGVTLIVAGIFPTDPKPGYPPGTTGTTAATTVPGIIHDLNALPCFAALTAAVLVLAVRFAGEPGRRRWVWCSSAIALAVAVTFVLSGVLFSQAAAAGTLNTSDHGLVQRLTITLGFGWLSVIALLLLRDQPGRAGSTARTHRHSSPVHERGTPNQRPAWCRNANNSLSGKRLESPYQDSTGREAARYVGGPPGRRHHGRPRRNARTDRLAPAVRRRG